MHDVEFAGGVSNDAEPRPPDHDLVKERASADVSLVPGGPASAGNGTKVSIIVPARNEEHSIGPCLQRLRRVLHEEHDLVAEIIVVDDASTDGTAQVVLGEMQHDPTIRLVRRLAPSGFGRAVRAGLAHVTGDVVVISMADGSDDPADVVRYVRKIEEGYDGVFGSRFLPGARVVNYPVFKLALNRLANRWLQLLFWTPFNDLTNAFKAYRTRVIRECGPFSANHFDLTLEIALRVLMRSYRVAQVPVDWTGRTAGRSKLNVMRMGLRYLAVVVVVLARRQTDAPPLAWALRGCAYGLIALVAVRAAAYLLYVGWLFPFPLETHLLEAAMVHHAWRVQNGGSLYPAWEDYPHVTNFFTPVYFWIVGGIGRVTGGGIPELFIIGRLVSFLSTLLAAGCLAWYLRVRHGRRIALWGGLLSVGAAPLYGFSIMTRPDAAADAIGLAGLLLTMIGGRTPPIVGSALLVVAILTKQTAAIYLLAAILMCLVERRYARGWLLAGASAGGLAVVSIVLTTSSAPLFLRSVMSEGRSPLSGAGWIQTTARLAIWSPELFLFSVAGAVWWLRRRDHGLAVATITLLAGSLLATLKLGSDLNYFLPLRATCVLAAGSLWAAAREEFPRRPSWVVAAAASALLVLVPSTWNALRAAHEVWALSSFVESPSGARMLGTYTTLIRLVQTEKARVLTDVGLLALHQRDRAPFVDPWLFRLLVDSGRIEPRRMEQWLESRSYDYLVLTADLYSRAYDDYAFGLPLPLVQRARGRYVQVGYAAGLFIYQPRLAQ